MGAARCLWVLRGCWWEEGWAEGVRERDVGMSWEAEGTVGSSLDQGEWVIAKSGKREDISAAFWEDDSGQDQTWLHVSPSPNPSRAPGLAKPVLNQLNLKKCVFFGCGVPHVGS